MQFVVKIIITTLIIVTVSELAKRFTIIATILASLPLVSLLAIVWLYHDTRDVGQIIDFSAKMFWAVLPSLVFFLILPALLRAGIAFFPAITVSVLVMVVTYWLYIILLKKTGIGV